MGSTEFTDAYGNRNAKNARRFALISEKAASADPQLIAIAQSYLPQLRGILQADLESGPIWCQSDQREMFGRLLFKLLNDIESRINELRRSARPTSDEVEALPPKPADAVAHLLDQPFNITCPNCKHEFHETFRWLEANESVKCPDCNATLVLEFKDRGTLTKLQSSFAELQTSLAGLQETVGKFNRRK